MPFFGSKLIATCESIYSSSNIICWANVQAPTGPPTLNGSRQRTCHLLCGIAVIVQSHRRVWALLFQCWSITRLAHLHQDQVHQMLTQFLRKFEPVVVLGASRRRPPHSARRTHHQPACVAARSLFLHGTFGRSAARKTGKRQKSALRS